MHFTFLPLALLMATGGIQAQQAKQPVHSVQVQISRASSDASDSLAPIENPVTVEQIREYLQLSGDLDSFRARWIAAVDRNRSVGAPYWPESFRMAIKDEMQKTDLMPMYVSLYQHSISRELMQEVLDAYHRLGSINFKGSPECVKMGDAELSMTDDMDKLKLTKTSQVIQKIYAVYKPQIKAARAQYMVEHPDWVDK